MPITFTEDSKGRAGAIRKNGDDVTFHVPVVVYGPDGVTPAAGMSMQLLNMVTSTGVGTLAPIKQFRSYIFEVWGTATTFTLHLEVVGPSTTPRTVNRVWDELNGVFIPNGDITKPGIYSVSVPAFMSIQATVTAISGGNVSVSGGLMSDA